jgi:phenylalanyl-tRNA synthetase beta chain
VVVAQLDLAALEHALPAARTYRAISPFPAVRQDLAVLVGSDVRAADLLATARSSAGALLEGAEVFDRYVGDQVPEGQASLAIELRFRAPDRTLTDEDVTAARSAVVDALAAAHGARLREG